MECMTYAILIFTFSPIQSFIGEARRAADLYAGSKILSRLANTAGHALGEEKLIYPAKLDPNDTPNKLVALVPFEQVEQIAKDAEARLLETWRDIAETARNELNKYQPAPDETWNEIWDRQLERVWEIYWVAQKMQGDYHAAFKKASSALDAVKRTRAFQAAEEDGMKDSLSGRRSALRVANGDAKSYWTRIGEKLKNPALLRPEGKERLDTLGAVKRFCKLDDKDDKDEKKTKRRFLSVSSVATADFLEQALEKAKPQLQAHRDAVQSWAYRVRDDEAWPYDGDLFFPETLTKDRAKDGYGQSVCEADLDKARRTLSELLEQVRIKPSPYYAIIQLDGDSMGEKISQCTEHQHREFSQSLAKFAERVKGIVHKHHGELIYNGGDDVLALAPLSQALLLARELAQQFNEIVREPINPNVGCSMSAGLAIAHHLYPLDATLSAARNAEKQAKGMKDKNALCARVLKRSGEMVEARSKWDEWETLQNIIELFRNEAVSSKLAYDVIRSAYALSEADAAFQSELYRLLKRHRDIQKLAEQEARDCAERLRVWALHLPDQSAELGKWLAIARFVAQGGGE
jgi:CRISPR-associated protein Cmr2